MMKAEEITEGIPERFQVDCGVVSSVIEDYLVNKISHDQLKEQLRHLILQRGRIGAAGLPLESL